VSQRIGRSKERERHGRMAGWWNIESTHNIYQLSLLSYMGIIHGTPEELE